MAGINVPGAWLAAPTNNDQSLKERLAEIRRKLLAGEKVEVNSKGTIQTNTSGTDATPGPRLEIPPGKLAASFYWYENNPELFQGERRAMAQFFPEFRLQKETDGRLSWLGTVQPGALSGGSPKYTILAVYSHNHPSNDSYGGSVKVYVVNPDLEQFANGQLIPHTLHDSANQLYLCTARPEDIRTGRVNTSAASSIGMAVKWLAAFEMWVSGEISTEQFGAHDNI
jgi:hypothetical protein